MSDYVMKVTDIYKNWLGRMVVAIENGEEKKKEVLACGDGLEFDPASAKIKLVDIRWNESTKKEFGNKDSYYALVQSHPMWVAEFHTIDTNGKVTKTNLCVGDSIRLYQLNSNE